LKKKKKGPERNRKFVKRRSNLCYFAKTGLRNNLCYFAKTELQNLCYFAKTEPKKIEHKNRPLFLLREEETSVFCSKNRAENRPLFLFFSTKNRGKKIERRRRRRRRRRKEKEERRKKKEERRKEKKKPLYFARKIEQKTDLCFCSFRQKTEEKK